MNVLKLARLLAANEWPIVLFSSSGTRLSLEARELDIEQLEVETQRKYFDFRRARHLARLMKQKNISTLLSFDNRDANLLFLVKRFYHRQLKWIYQQHMQIGVKKKDLLHRATYKQIDLWVSPLNFLKDNVVQNTHVSPEKIKVIPLGLDTDHFTGYKETKASARKLLEIDSERMLLGIAGRISEKKGQLFLLEAFNRLIEQGVEVDLVIMGQPTINETESQIYYEKLQNRIADLNLQSRVFMLPYQNDVRPFYAAIDVFVLASTGETYGMVTIEAMLSECIIVATQSGGTPEILQYGELGLLYKPGEQRELVKLIKFICANSEKSQAMAEKARENAIERFSLQAEVSEIEKLL